MLMDINTICIIKVGYIAWLTDLLVSSKRDTNCFGGISLAFVRLNNVII